MEEPIKRFVSVQKRAVDATSITHIVVDCLFEAMNGVGRGVSFFETELVRKCYQILGKQTPQEVLEYLCQQWRYGDATII